MSNKRGGLSKREYAAKQAGGSLNYKTGKISTPKKSSSKSSSSNPYAKYQSMDWGSAAEAFKRDRGLSSDADLTGSDFDLAMNYQYNRPNYESLIKKNANIGPWAAGYGSETEYGKGGTKAGNTYSQREQAAKAVSNRSGVGDIVRKGLGINTANASGGTISAPRKKGIIERGLEIAKDPFGLEPRLRAFFNDAPWGSKIYQAESGAVDAITQALTGTTPELGFSEKYLRDETPMFQDSPIEDNSPRQTPKQDPSPVVHENNDNDNRRTSSRQVSNPIFTTPAPTPSLSDYINGGSPQSFPTSSAGQESNRTQRRFLGNGLLSKGTYANGKGDYGMEGTFGTNQLSKENNLINQLLGIPTAQAAETSLFSQPNTNSFGLPYTGYSSQNGGMSTRYGLDQAPTFTPKNTSNEEYESSATGGNTAKPTGGSVSGGVAQQYSQQSENPQQKLYEQQIKNAKKVMEETIGAIKKQYGVSEETGTQALNKQKQEDLNALNARFSFGLNQDPNSEQAIQYAQRTNNDYAGQLSDFLSKLAASRTQDISSAKQNYYTQKNSAQEKLAQLMASLEEARINNAKKLSSAGTTAESKKQAAIMKLLNQAANMPSGGREYAQQIANIQGLGDISGYTPNGWENAYNPNFGKTTSNIVSIGNGYVLDKDTGDVYQAYE